METPVEWVLPDQIAEWKLEPELAWPIPRQVVLKRSFVVREAVALMVALPIPLLLTILAAEIWGGTAMVVFASMAVLLAGYIVYSFECERQFSKLLVSRGLAARGFIVHREWTSETGDASVSGVDFAISYDKPAGFDVQGTCKALPWWVNLSETVTRVKANDRPAQFYYIEHRLFRNPKPGETLTLLYLPDVPERPMLYEDCVYRAARSGESR